MSGAPWSTGELRDFLASGEVDGPRLSAIGLLFRRWQSEAGGGFSLAPWPDDVRPEELELATVERLAEELRGMLRSPAPEELRPTATWALGKLARGEDRKLFEALLAAALEEGDDELLHQAMIALRKLGAFDILGGWDEAPTSAITPEDAEENRRRARLYLDTLG